MSVNTLRIIIAGGLFLHGIAHGVALVALLRQTITGTSIDRPSVRTWLYNDLSPRTAAALALPFWGVAALCFVAASVSLEGILSQTDWRQLAVAGAIIGTCGIAIFPLPWPGSPSTWRSLLNTSIALAVNVVVLDTQLSLHWPPLLVFGS